MFGPQLRISVWPSPLIFSVLGGNVHSVQEKVEFSLKRRVEAFRNQHGELSQPIERKLTKLNELSENIENYYEKMKKIIRYIQGRLIP